MKDRFDLEQKIAKTTSFSDNLRDLSNDIINNKLSTDKVVDALNGLATLIESHTGVTIDILKQVFEIDQYRNYQENMQK